MARFYFGDIDVLGRRFVFSSQPDQPVEIVGVVEDTLQRNRTRAQCIANERVHAVRPR
jgi:hypothetical protein